MADLMLLALLNAEHPGVRALAKLELRRVVEGIALRHPNVTTREAADDWLRVSRDFCGRSQRLTPARVSLRPRALRATRLLQSQE